MADNQKEQNYQKLAKDVRDKSQELKNEASHKLRMYKMPMELKTEDTHKMVRGYSIGQDQGRDHKHILLTGMIGVGKSHFINTITNYVFGVDNTDDFRFKLVVDLEESMEQEAYDRKAESMTSFVTSYTFYWQEGFRIPYSLTIIDTPGFGDTRGDQFDEKIVSQMEALFKNNSLLPKQQLSSVGLIVKANEARLTEEQKNMFNKILDIFDKDLGKNTLITFTFADYNPPVALSSIEALEIPYSDHFKINNSFIYADVAQDIVMADWKDGFGELEKYFDALGGIQQIDLKKTCEVLEGKAQLCIIQKDIETKILQGLTSLEKMVSVLKQCHDIECIIQENKGFERKKSILKTEPKISENTYWNCNTCNQSCLRNNLSDNVPYLTGSSLAVLAFSFYYDFILLSRVVVCVGIITGIQTLLIYFKTCDICKHPRSDHVSEKIQKTMESVEITEADEKMQERYNTSICDRSGKKKILANMLKECQERNQELANLIKKANGIYQKLQTITIKSSARSSVQIIENLLDKAKRNIPRTPDRVTQLENLKTFATRTSSSVPLSKTELEIEQFLKDE